MNKLGLEVTKYFAVTKPDAKVQHVDICLVILDAKVQYYLKVTPALLHLVELNIYYLSSYGTYMIHNPKYIWYKLITQCTDSGRNWAANKVLSL